MYFKSGLCTGFTVGRCYRSYSHAFNISNGFKVNRGKADTCTTTTAIGDFCFVYVSRYRRISNRIFHTRNACYYGAVFLPFHSRVGHIVRYFQYRSFCRVVNLASVHIFRPTRCDNGALCHYRVGRSGATSARTAYGSVIHSCGSYPIFSHSYPLRYLCAVFKPSVSSRRVGTSGNRERIHLSTKIHIIYTVVNAQCIAVLQLNI